MYCQCVCSSLSYKHCLAWCRFALHCAALHCFANALLCCVVPMLCFALLCLQKFSDGKCLEITALLTSIKQNTKTAGTSGLHCVCCVCLASAIVYTFISTYIHPYVRIHRHELYIYACMRKSIHLRIHVYMYTCLRLCVDTYIYIYIYI